MAIYVIGLSHHSAPVEVRERFAFAEAQLPAALRALRDSGVAEEAVILSTCNRVEIYAAAEGESPASALRAFLLRAGQGAEPAAAAIYEIGEPQSLQHLFRVAAGLDSMVLGETEIFGQLKDAYQLALQQGHTGSRLNRAFQHAFNAAKHLRTHTQIQRGAVSVGSVAAELAGRIFESLAERQVMVLGAGDISEKTARALLSRGARSILVSNRSYDRAVALASELGGRAVRFDGWTAEFHAVDIVISSTAAPHYVLDRARLEPLMRLRRNRPLLLIDIAVPRDLDPEINLMENVYLYNIDDLQTIADDHLRQRREEIERCEAIIRERVESLLRRPAGSPPSAPSRPAFGHE